MRINRHEKNVYVQQKKMIIMNIRTKWINKDEYDDCYDSINNLQDMQLVVLRSFEVKKMQYAAWFCKM